MKHILSNIPVWLRTALATVAAFLFCNVAFAQGGGGADASAVLDSISNQMESMVSTVITIARIGMIIGGVILLIMVIFNLFKGERDAAGKLGWWVVGLAIGLGILTIVQGFI